MGAEAPPAATALTGQSERDSHRGPAASVPNLHLPEVIASEADGVPLRSAQTCFLL